MRSFSDVKHAFKGSNEAKSTSRSLKSLSLTEQELDNPGIRVRPCQEAYFEHGTPTVVKDNDADIFRKHETSTQCYKRFKPCYPKVVVVEREVSLDEDSVLSDVDEAAEFCEDVQAKPNDRISPTAVFLQALQRNIDATPPPQFPPPRSASLMNESTKPAVGKRKPQVHFGYDLRMSTSSETLPALPPPLPEKSKLRPLPPLPAAPPVPPKDFEHGASEDETKGRANVSEPFNLLNIRARISSVKLPHVFKIEATEMIGRIEEEGKNHKRMDFASAVGNLRSRVGSFKMLSKGVLARNYQDSKPREIPEEVEPVDDQTEKPALTAEKQIFSDGQRLLRDSLRYAREKKQYQMGETEPPPQLVYNDDLEADARVTANGEDIRASFSKPSKPDRLKNTGEEPTRIEPDETTGQVKLIGPAGTHAFTLGEKWASGSDKRHMVRGHEETMAPGHDESCFCHLHRVFEIITDDSYKYWCVARAAKTERWVVHLAKEKPMAFAEVATNEHTTMLDDEAINDLKDYPYSEVSWTEVNEMAKRVSRELSDKRKPRHNIPRKPVPFRTLRKSFIMTSTCS